MNVPRAASAGKIIERRGGYFPTVFNVKTTIVHETVSNLSQLRDRIFLLSVAGFYPARCNALEPALIKIVF